MTRQHSSLHPYLHVHRQRTKTSALPFTCVPTSARATAPHARRQHGASRHPRPQRCAQAHAACANGPSRTVARPSVRGFVQRSFWPRRKNTHAPAPSEKKQSERTSHCSLHIHRPHRWGPALLSTATARAADVRQRARSHARMNGPSGAAAQRAHAVSLPDKKPAWKQCVSSTNTLNAESPNKAHPQCPCVPLPRYIDKSRFTECG